MKPFLVNTTRMAINIAREQSSVFVVTSVMLIWAHHPVIWSVIYAAGVASAFALLDPLVKRIFSAITHEFFSADTSIDAISTSHNTDPTSRIWPPAPNYPKHQD